MTATLHRLPPRPASRNIAAARQTLADETASTQSRLNAADMMTIFGDDLDVRDAAAFRRQITEEIEAARAPFAWVEDDPPSASGPTALMLIGAVLVALAIGWWAMAMATEVNATLVQIEVQP